jgi:hypothetical protein
VFMIFIACFFGKDPVTGGAASRLEAGLWTALLLLPTSKLVEGIKEIKAGNRFLRGLDLTADELRILDKAGYFEDVAKIEKVSGAKIPTLNSLADEVASSLGGKASPLKNGYKVEIPNGRKPIVVRIMGEGSGGRGNPYYRVSIDGKGSLTSEGIISSDRGLTHIDLSENSLNEITNIINNYLGRK